MSILGSVLVVLCLVDAPAKDVAADGKSLQGSWTATTAENGGRKVEQATIQVVFKDDSLRLFEENKLLATATFRLQADGEARLIDLSFTEGSIKGTHSEGIYALKGNDLRICFSLNEKERPTEFTSAPGSQFLLLVLQRDKP
jgi:uncharacterized protein (TIGR03067 family)